MQADGVAMRKTAFDLEFSSFESSAYAAPDAEALSAATPRVSAIIVTYNTGLSLWECLEAVAEDDSIGEVLIVNNGNPKDQETKLQEFVAERAKKFQLINGNGNVGFSKACNIGAKGAHGRYVLFLNPDAVLERGAVNAMIAAGESRPGMWLAGGLLLDVFGKEQRGARRGKLTLWNAAASFTGLSNILSKIGGAAFREVHWEEQPLPIEPAVVPTVSGALMLMPTAQFRQIGGFDESYFLHVEDIDLCRRIGDAGGDVVFAPTAHAKHYGSTSSANRLWIEWQKGRGLDIYFRKFARTPLEEVCAFFLSPVMRLALVARALYLSVRLNRRSANMKRLRALASERRVVEETEQQYPESNGAVRTFA
jgi:N-acetylglucosaminyl-diphospho-decaprenol L-rhamnosyltransferase